MCAEHVSEKQLLKVSEVLASLRGKSIFFEPVGGNNGDVVIEMGTRELLGQLGIEVHGNKSNAQVILINGNGGLGVELYQPDMPAIKHYAQRFRDKPLVMLPASYHFQNNLLGDCFRGRTAPAIIFAREQYSYKLLQTQTFSSDVQIGIDHDMAFNLIGSETIRALQARIAAKHILLVERFDVETATGGKPKEVRAPLPWKRALPVPIRNLGKKIIHTRRAAQTGFKSSILQRLYTEAPQFKGLPVFAHDISSIIGFTFEQFTQLIVESAVVVTTRLHVGILAALIGKPTYLFTGKAPYPKIKGVYEYSLAEMPHVHLW